MSLLVDGLTGLGINPIYLEEVVRKMAIEVLKEAHYPCYLNAAFNMKHQQETLAALEQDTRTSS